MTYKIEKLYKSSRGYQMIISGLDRTIRISSDLIRKYQLKQGTCLDPKLFDELIHDAEWENCYNDALRYLGYREHGTVELRLKLQRREHSKEVSIKVIRKLSNDGYLDDERFARALAKNTLNRKPAGRSYLLASLIKKCIDRETAAKVVDELLQDHDETDLAVSALKSKWRQYSHLNLETARSRAYNYLSRRGISYNAAKTAFEQMLNNETEE